MGNAKWPRQDGVLCIPALGWVCSFSFSPLITHQAETLHLQLILTLVCSTKSPFPLQLIGLPSRFFFLFPDGRNQIF